MGWTGQTRRVMWTGQKPLPVRVNLRALIVMHHLRISRVRPEKGLEHTLFQTGKVILIF